MSSLRFFFFLLYVSCVLGNIANPFLLFFITFRNSGWGLCVEGINFIVFYIFFLIQILVGAFYFNTHDLYNREGALLWAGDIDVNQRVFCELKEFKSDDVFFCAYFW